MLILLLLLALITQGKRTGKDIQWQWGEEVDKDESDYDITVIMIILKMLAIVVMMIVVMILTSDWENASSWCRSSI